ncbi:M23 family metallopeptidase [Wenzhouxiangella sp. AB-CW3]|uniref:peptidoglycan DD-metalloendopeptidase family protein n=1 Tax=Wenzhouxiangella sp. AB-CW3 TaxID=2771012 RepID=UPI00168A876B|nr:M23 family metallopeptidase [Wenzhouxiangella sp. AB-CW3]QOC22910.1 M23 family metallopeptidase [Wenzhouxiangella sp. AB-CW3]
MILLLLFSLTLVSTPAWAQTIYIYEDEHGVTHFTDRQPETEREVTIQRAVAEPEEMLDVRRHGPSESPVWMFRNRTHGPLAVRVALGEQDNVVTQPMLPHTFVLGPLEDRELVTIGPFDRYRSWSYRLETESLPGRPDAAHRPGQPYRAPFSQGARFRIGQAFGGSFSHDQPSNYHAVDIAMPVGTPVHAAREGVVMDQARYFHGAGEDMERYGDRANFVRLLHDDGTMAVYAHLDYEGVRVAPGQRVERGQLIGKSGNTGFTTGPHLHFVVQKNRNMELVSVPFEFGGTNGSGVTPRQGLRLEAR